MSSTNRGNKIKNDDFYVTPCWVTQIILPKLNWDNLEIILDPCAGDGAILDAIDQLSPIPLKLNGIEINAEKAKLCQEIIHCETRDALSPVPWDKSDLIVMNPPFSLAQEFCERALKEISENGEVAALMRLAMLESKKRKTFWEQHPADVYILSQRPAFVNNKTDSVAYAWFVWGKNRGNKWFRLEA